MPHTASPITRRRFIAGAGATAAALALQPQLAAGASLIGARDETLEVAPAPAVADGAKHLAWVWQFSVDGSASQVRRVLSQNQMGVVLKTHDGTAWMSQYDRTADAVNGPRKVGELVRYFEDSGVPFHAWCVVHGLQPIREAEMAAEVLNAGARSLMIDLEPHAGFWRGSWGDAVAFGHELRKRAPDAWVVTSVDPRPWLIDGIPLTEFAAFSNELAPQVYWDSFRTLPNVQRFIASGYAPPAGGVTPRFALDNAVQMLRRYKLPIHPIGEATTRGAAWSEFLDRAYEHGAESVSAWRFGVTTPEVWSVLAATPPRPSGYTVQPGDTLAKIAARFSTSAGALAEANGITNIDRIEVGQQLVIPPGAAPVAAVVPASAPREEPQTVQLSSGGEHVVQPGETLGTLARRWNTSVSAIAEANGITNPNVIRVGQVLRIPGGAAAPAASAPAAAPTAGGSYVVQPGDTLGTLARRWNTSVSAITARNGIANPNLIRVGQRLAIP